MVSNTIEKAKKLIAIGAYVFPVYVTRDKDNPYKTTKKPGTENGFYDATNDPYYCEELFSRHPNADVGVWMGASGLVALDIDVKRSPDGAVLVDGFESFEKAWLELPETFSFESSSKAGGRQYIYAAPKNVTLGPKGQYRGMEGVDRRAGNSYSVWGDEVPASRSVFAPAPEWLCDVSTIRSAAAFNGTVKDWFDTLEPGEPNLLVRGAIERARKDFEAKGNDWDHSSMIERQFEAVRLGAEGNPGVPELLQALEDLFFERTGEHTRPESEWAFEFAEGLASGITKYGDAIALRKSLPKYSLSMVPKTVPDHLVTGEPSANTGEDFRALLAALTNASTDDLAVTSILWNAPRTRSIAHEWGVEFIHKRVLAARVRPEPTRENPSLEPVREENSVEAGTFLTEAEQNIVDSEPTFIEYYVEQSSKKGFVNRTYAVPAAWILLSMTFGEKAFLPLPKNPGMNLWFQVLGYSGTGKSSEDSFLRDIMNAIFLDGGEHYNLGALSSPEGLQHSLVARDKLPSIIHHDEAAEFFQALRLKDWAAPLENLHSKLYDGFVEPSNKVNLKEARGKSAHTSLSMLMLGTPDRVLSELDLSMFGSGYLSRMNWVWGEPSRDPDVKYRIRLQENRTTATPLEVFEVASNLLEARNNISTVVAMKGTEEAQERIEAAAKAFDTYARTSDRYTVLEPAVTRLGTETLWKCTSLLALYRGSDTFVLEDALVAISHASEWLRTMIRVASNMSESAYSRSLEAIEAYVRANGSVSRASLLHHFRGTVLRTKNEIDDRIGYLLESGRINKVSRGETVAYTING